MTAKELDNEVENWCIDTILKSDLEEWIDSGKIKINTSNGYVNFRVESDYFYVSFFDNSTEIKTLYVHSRWLVFPFSRLIRTKKEFEIQKQINKKLKEINYLINNKREYDSALRVYNLLPIKEIRKRKLEEIENDTNNN